MSEINDLLRKNKNLLIKGIGKSAYNRDLTADEIIKLEIMLEFHKKIPEIIYYFRTVGERAKNDKELAVSQSKTFKKLREMDYESEDCRTPLEKNLNLYIKS